MHAEDRPVPFLLIFKRWELFFMFCGNTGINGDIAVHIEHICHIHACITSCIIKRYHSTENAQFIYIIKSKFLKILFLFIRSFCPLFPQYIYRGLFTPSPAPWQLNNTQSDCGAAAFCLSERKICGDTLADTVSLYGDAMTFMTEREILQCTIPFAAGTAMTGAVLTMILPPRGGPARSAGGTGKSLIHVPAGRFGVW